MKNKKKTLNIILFGIIAMVGLSVFLITISTVQGGLYVHYNQSEPSLNDLVQFNWDAAGLFIALLCLGIVAWTIRFATVSVPSFKSGIKGNNIPILLFDIISIVMLLGMFLAILIPIGQPYWEVFGINTQTLKLEPNAFYYVLVNMTLYSPLAILVSSLISGIVYNYADKKLCPLNTSLFGVTTTLSFGILLAGMFAAAKMYIDVDPSRGVKNAIEWRIGALLLTFLLICLIAQIVRLIMVSIPSFKKNGIKGNNVAILIFDIITLAVLCALLIAMFLPVGTITADNAQSYADRVTAAENIVLYAPAMVTISSLVSGVVTNHSSK